MFPSSDEGSNGSTNGSNNGSREGVSLNDGDIVYSNNSAKFNLLIQVQTPYYYLNVLQLI